MIERKAAESTHRFGPLIDEVAMFVPAARDRVEIVGRAGVFLVLTVYSELSFAYLVRLDELTGETEHLPFAMLRPHSQDVPLELHKV